MRTMLRRSSHRRVEPLAEIRAVSPVGARHDGLRRYAVTLAADDEGSSRRQAASSAEASDQAAYAFETVGIVRAEAAPGGESDRNRLRGGGSISLLWPVSQTALLARIGEAEQAQRPAQRPANAAVKPIVYRLVLNTRKRLCVKHAGPREQALLYTAQH